MPPDRMLTKDERHMLSAALAVLRANVLDQPGRRGGIAGPALYEALLRLDMAEDYGRRVEAETWWARVLAEATRAVAWPTAFLPRPERRHRERILRARLALAIRAVLRADRGEPGAWWAVDEDDPHGIYAHEYAVSIARRYGGTVRRREALWTMAPSHEAGGEGR